VKCYNGIISVRLRIILCALIYTNKHLVSHEAPRSAILSDTARADVPSLCTFLEVLSGNGLEYDSNDIDCYTLPHMCYHINSEVLTEEAPELTPPDQSAHSHTNYLR